MTLEDAMIMEKLAANQGLYNSFLSFGLIAGLLARSPIVAKTLIVFCLVCVIVAGLYGAWSVAPRILLIQTLPAVLALAAIWKTGVGHKE